MNQAERYIRNSFIALAIFIVAGTGISRVYASIVDENTPQWLRSVISLGLAISVNKEAATPVKNSQLVDFSQLRDFTRISVEGDFAVEIVSAPQYKVGLTPAGGEAWSVESEWQKDGLLHLKGGPGTAGAVLRVEAPALTSIEAHDLRQLTVRGWKAKEMTIRMKSLPGLRIEESAVERWTLHSETPVEVQADKATMSAGLNVETNGRIDIRGPSGTIQLRGTGGQVSIRTNK